MYVCILSADMLLSIIPVFISKMDLHPRALSIRASACQHETSLQRLPATQSNH